MEKKKFDAIITDALEDKAEPVLLSPVRAEAMKKRLGKMMKEESHMKKSMIKKVIIAAAAMCLLVPAAAVAAGRIVSYSTFTSRNDAIKTYGQILEKAPGWLGYTPVTVEKFGNGFSFSEGYLHLVKAQDEESNQVGSFPELTMDYKNGSRAVTFTVSRPLDAGDNNAADSSESFEGITVNYKVDHYKFVPEDYKLTEEDEMRIASGDLLVSYGTEQVELNDISYVYWEQDGTNYLMMSSGGSQVSRADLMEMAKEVIGSGK